MEVFITDKRVAIAELIGLVDGMSYTIEHIKRDLSFEHDDRISDHIFVVNEFVKRINEICNHMTVKKVDEYCDE